MTAAASMPAAAHPAAGQTVLPHCLVLVQPACRGTAHAKQLCSTAAAQSAAGYKSVAHYLVLSQQAGAQPAAEGVDVQAAAPAAEAEQASGAEAAPAADDMVAAAPVAAGMPFCASSCFVTKEGDHLLHVLNVNSALYGQRACPSQMPRDPLLVLRAYMCNATQG